MSADIAEWEEIFYTEQSGNRPVMSMPPRVKATKKFIQEVAIECGIDDIDVAVKAADWIADKMERFAAAHSQPVFDMDGNGPICSFCTTIWPLCGHHHLTIMDLDGASDDAGDAA